MLTLEIATELRAKLAKRAELAQQKIVMPDADSARAQLDSEIVRTLFEHAGELLGCWFVVQREYAPLLSAIAPLLGRLSAMSKLATAEQNKPA